VNIIKRHGFWENKITPDKVNELPKCKKCSNRFILNKNDKLCDNCY